MNATGGLVERRCIYCGSTEINRWKSWNGAGEWVCDDCWPDDPAAEFDW